MSVMQNRCHGRLHEAEAQRAWVSAVHWNCSPSSAICAGWPNRKSWSPISVTLRAARLISVFIVPCMPSTRRCSHASTMPAQQAYPEMPSALRTVCTSAPACCNGLAVVAKRVRTLGFDRLVKLHHLPLLAEHLQHLALVHLCWHTVASGYNRLKIEVMQGQAQARLVQLRALSKVTDVRESNRPDWKCGTTADGSEPSDRISSSVGSLTK